MKKIMISAILAAGIVTNSFATESLLKTQKIKNDLILPYTTFGHYTGNITKDKLFSYGLFYSHNLSSGNNINLDLRETKLTYTNNNKDTKIYEGTFLYNKTYFKNKFFNKIGYHLIRENNKYLGGKGDIFILGFGKYKYNKNKYMNYSLDIYYRKLTDTNVNIIQFSPKISFTTYSTIYTIKYEHILDYGRSNKVLGPNKKNNHYGYHFNIKYYTSLWNLGTGIFIGNETGLVSNGGFIGESDGDTYKLGINGELNYNINKDFSLGYKVSYGKYDSSYGTSKLITNSILASYKF